MSKASRPCVRKARAARGWASQGPANRFTPTTLPCDRQRRRVGAGTSATRFDGRHFLNNPPGSVNFQTRQHVSEAAWRNLQFQLQKREFSHDVYRQYLIVALQALEFRGLHA